MVIGFCLEDFSLSCFVAHGVGNTAGVYHACELHAGETCCKHLGKHEFVEGITIVVDVDFFGAPTVKERMSFLPLRAVPVEP